MRAHSSHAHPRRTYPKWGRLSLPSSWTRRAAIAQSSSRQHTVWPLGSCDGATLTQERGYFPRQASPRNLLWRDGKPGVRVSGTRSKNKHVLCEQSHTPERSWPLTSGPSMEDNAASQERFREAVAMTAMPLPRVTPHVLSPHALPTTVVHRAATVASPLLLPKVGRTPSKSSGWVGLVLRVGD